MTWCLASGPLYHALAWLLAQSALRGAGDMDCFIQLRQRFWEVYRKAKCVEAKKSMRS